MQLVEKQNEWRGEGRINKLFAKYKYFFVLLFLFHRLVSK